MMMDLLTEERGGWLLVRSGSSATPSLIEQMENSGSEVVLGQETMLIKREVIQAIGPLEARLPFSWRQADFLFRARRAGFSTMVIPPMAPLPPFPSESATEAYLWWRGRLLFIERNLSRKERLHSWLRTLAPELMGAALMKRRQRRVTLASLRAVWHHLICCPPNFGTVRITK